jgi:hypothetical protein
VDLIPTLKAFFKPSLNVQNAAAIHPATITALNDDGTVNLIAHDGHDTPQENVPLVEPGAEPPATGFWAQAQHDGSQADPLAQAPEVGGFRESFKDDPLRNPNLGIEDDLGGGNA